MFGWNGNISAPDSFSACSITISPLTKLTVNRAGFEVAGLNEFFRTLIATMFGWNGNISAPDTFSTCNITISPLTQLTMNRAGFEVAGLSEFFRTLIATMFGWNGNISAPDSFSTCSITISPLSQLTMNFDFIVGFVLLIAKFPFPIAITGAGLFVRINWWNVLLQLCNGHFKGQI